jgi:hypothetical protein
MTPAWLQKNSHYAIAALKLLEDGHAQTGKERTKLSRDGHVQIDNQRTHTTYIIAVRLSRRTAMSEPTAQVGTSPLVP